MRVTEERPSYSDIIFKYARIKSLDCGRGGLVLTRWPQKGNYRIVVTDEKKNLYSYQHDVQLCLDHEPQDWEKTLAKDLEADLLKYGFLREGEEVELRYRSKP